MSTPPNDPSKPRPEAPLPGGNGTPPAGMPDPVPGDPAPAEAASIDPIPVDPTPVDPEVAEAEQAAREAEAAAAAAAARAAEQAARIGSAGGSLRVTTIRLLRMLWRMLGYGLVAGNLVAWAWILGASDALKQQAFVTAEYVLGFGFLVTLAKEVLSPRSPELRMLPLADYRAGRLFTVVRTLLFIVLGTHWAIYLVKANAWGESVAALLSVTEQVGLTFFGWGALRRSGILDKFIPKDADSYHGLLSRLLIKAVLPLGVLTLLFYIIATALGYGTLSNWVVQKALWTSGFILILGIVYRLLKSQLHRTLSFMRDESVAVAAIEEGKAASPWYIGVERILMGLLKILTAAGLVHGVLTIWTVTYDSIDAVLAHHTIIGNQSWGSLVGGLGMAVFAWIGYGFLRNLLIFMIFPRADVEAGARYAMLTVLKYVAWTVIGVLALTAIGADTSTLAVFAGGASVGLGFAMKDVFSNFFGGLIMLLERPVRVGDTIEVSGIVGKVEAIRLRGTLLRTFDGTTVMIPNTSMISTNLANLTHGFQTARMQIDVGVSYSENPADVEKILLDIAHSDPRVVADPAPAVRFNNFGASSLDFTLRIWTHDISVRWEIVSELRHRIFEAFKEAGIEIPFNQMDLHLRSDDRPAAQLPPPAATGSGTSQERPSEAPRERV